jgi:hypothetical protein
MPWWSAKLQELKTVFRNASEAKGNNKTVDTIELYRAAKQVYQRELRKAAQDSWKQLCSSELNSNLFEGL